MPGETTLKRMPCGPNSSARDLAIFCSAAFAEAVANADNYILTDSEAKIKAIVSSGGVKKAKAYLKPMAPGKPIWKDSNKLRRIALPLVLLLAVIIGSVLSVNIVNIVNKFTHTNH